MSRKRPRTPPYQTLKKALASDDLRAGIKALRRRMAEDPPEEITHFLCTPEQAAPALAELARGYIQHEVVPD